MDTAQPTASLRPIAEAFPLGDYLERELEARGWNSRDLAARMGGDYGINCFVVDAFLLVRDDPTFLLGTETAAHMGAALGVSTDFLLNLHNSWREYALSSEAAVTNPVPTPPGDA